MVAQEGATANDVDKLVRIPGEEEGEGSTSEEWVDADVVSKIAREDTER